MKRPRWHRPLVLQLSIARNRARRRAQHHRLGLRMRLLKRRELIFAAAGWTKHNPQPIWRNAVQCRGWTGALVEAGVIG